MSESDAARVMFEMHINEPNFRGQNPARANDDEPADFVKQFFDDAAFKMESGVDPVKLEHQTARNDEQFEDFLTKSRAQIAGEKSAAALEKRSPYLFAKRISDAPLAKSEVTSRLYGLLEKLRGDCVNEEEEQLERAARCLDIPAFAQVAEGIVSRLKARKAA